MKEIALAILAVGMGIIACEYKDLVAGGFALLASIILIIKSL
jgi:hypothetical protein